MVEVECCCFWLVQANVCIFSLDTELLMLMVPDFATAALLLQCWQWSGFSGLGFNCGVCMWSLLQYKFALQTWICLGTNLFTFHSLIGKNRQVPFLNYFIKFWAQKYKVFFVWLGGIMGKGFPYLLQPSLLRIDCWLCNLFIQAFYVLVTINYMFLPASLIFWNIEIIFNNFEWFQNRVLQIKCVIGIENYEDKKLF